MLCYQALFFFGLYPFLKMEYGDHQELFIKVQIKITRLGLLDQDF